MALSGRLARGGWTEEITIVFIQALIRAAHPEQDGKPTTAPEITMKIFHFDRGRNEQRIPARRNTKEME